LEKGTTVIDFVALAGGVTDKANTKIIHTRNVDGKAKVTEIDLDVIMKDKADPANLTVEAGDMIVVPELKKLTVESTLNILTLVKLITDLFK
jgi:protein involved in polysaccharide export with SLBB domain